ncbi:MFS transporter [Croceicoccus ponticola]|uniref:MFS transporter n=1 Tax=Croceicoccus ponticola TaxID=2217664 RepID=A0A437GZA6_9SPHN|nr:MFS transporter [Croceicoccus ponticola]RVQ68679.1 MFS transporter [Croceicoccus ponticola]
MSVPSQSDQQPGWGAWGMVVILTLAYTLSFIDRQVLNLLVEPLKAEFDLSDTRLSLLQGAAFTIAYIAFSPILGRMADTSNRRNLLIGGVLLWSLATALCGLARSYWQLFAARFGVGAAEASLTPAAWSLIADRFPPHMMPRALSVLLMGPYLGGGLAMIFGGILLEYAAGRDFGILAPWQFVFIAVAVPGMVVAALLAFFVREPMRKLGLGEVSGDTMPLSEVGRRFRRNWRFYFNFYAGMGGLVITLYAFPAWLPAMLMRQFGADASVVGIQYGSLVLIGGSAGVLTGPLLTGWLERRGRRDALLIVPLLSAVLVAVLATSLAFAPSYTVALAIGGIASFCYSLPMAGASAALQIVTPNRMRGMASAVYVFAVSVIGLGTAPTIVALITDHVFHDEGMVGVSLALTSAVSALVGLVLLANARKAYVELLDTP